MNVQLDYAPPKPLFKRKWLRRMVGATMVAIVLGGSLVMSRDWIARKWHRYMLLQAQDRCLSYSPDARRIVYSEDAKTMAALLGSKKGYQHISMTVSAPLPALSYDYVFVAHDPWMQLWREMPLTSGTRGRGGAMPPSRPMVYLHGLNLPSGEKFLATVSFADRAESGLNFWYQTHDLFTNTPSSSEFLPLSGVVHLAITPAPPATRPITLFPAIPDAPYGMGFTMVYEVGGVEGHIKGHYMPRSPAPAGPGSVPNFPNFEMKIVDGPLKP